MIRKLTCIGCPMGCQIEAVVENGEAVSVSGNTCEIGRKYAEQEIREPKRMVTTTALTADGVPVPVKTKEAVPKDSIFKVMEAIKAAEVRPPVSTGDVLIEDAAGTGIAVVFTASR